MKYSKNSLRWVLPASLVIFYYFLFGCAAPPELSLTQPGGSILQRKSNYSTAQPDSSLFDSTSNYSTAQTGGSNLPFMSNQLYASGCTVLMGLRMGASLLSIFLMGLKLSRLASSIKKWRRLLTSATSACGIRFIWRKKYPSFEDMHSLFDRGDALMAAASVASTLQLAHGEVSKFLASHSTYKTDPWRRTVRTLTFIKISIRANSAERSQLVSWLKRIHVNIPMFQFETNVFVLSTMAYGLARAHQMLGGATEVELDAIVSAVMNMAKQLHPNHEGLEKRVPLSLSALTDYLSKELILSSSDLVKINRSGLDLLNGTIGKRDSPRQPGTLSSKTVSMFLHPLAWSKFFLTMRLNKDLCSSVLSPEFSRRPGLVLRVLQKLQPVFSHCHFTACPRFLTFDGLFELIRECDPSLRLVVDDVYHEIFREKATAAKFRHTTDKLGAHLPQLNYSDPKASDPLSVTSSTLSSAVVEHFKSSYLRGKLVGRSLPQHLGVIMDGNRRFAKQNHLGGPMEGHQIGARKLLQFMSWCFSSGINNLTVWALSDDNLKRGRQELDPLFAMMAGHIREIVMEDTPITVLDVRFRMVGDRSLIPESLLQDVDAAEKATRNNFMFNLNLALGYGGRAEATRAMKRAVEARAEEQSVSIEEALSSLRPDDVSKYTYSGELGLPDIDAILRTSGENRLSGFALWDTHAAEVAFIEPNWPALKESDFLSSILDLSGRQRRFGA